MSNTSDGWKTKASHIVRVATYNIHQGIGRDGREDIYRTAEAIHNLRADIVGIQELGSCSNRPDAFGSLQIKTIVQLTGMTAIEGPTIHHPNSTYGNCLLTRQTVHAVRRVNIGENGCEPRGLLDVDLNIRGIPLRVLVTHLGLQGWERRRQVRKIIAQMAKGDESPMVVMGDFNEWLPWSRALRSLRKRCGNSPALATFPAHFPVLALDRIWVSPREQLRRLQVVKTESTRIISDHLPLTAEIAISKPA